MTDGMTERQNDYIISAWSVEVTTATIATTEFQNRLFDTLLISVIFYFTKKKLKNECHSD